MEAFGGNPHLVELGEEIRLLFIAHADACVGDADADVLARVRLLMPIPGVSAPRQVGSHWINADADRPSWRSEFDSVG